MRVRPLAGLAVLRLSKEPEERASFKGLLEVDRYGTEDRTGCEDKVVGGVYALSADVEPGGGFGHEEMQLLNAGLDLVVPKCIRTHRTCTSRVSFATHIDSSNALEIPLSLIR